MRDTLAILGAIGFLGCFMGPWLAKFMPAGDANGTTNTGVEAE